MDKEEKLNVLTEKSLLVILCDAYKVNPMDVNSLTFHVHEGKPTKVEIVMFDKIIIKLVELR